MLTQKRILVIDDEERMCESIRSLLMPWGYYVDTAFSGHEAIDKLNQDNVYHVAVTDLKMTNGSGYDVMAHIQEHFPEILIIVITGHASTESAIESMRYTAFDYLTKPFEFDSLRLSIERAFAKLESQELRDDLISMITHDIKAPLTSIIGYAALIHDRKTGAVHPKAAEFADTIGLGAQRIFSLVDNFLTTCKYSAGKLIVANAPVALSDVLEDVLEMLDIQLKSAGQAIRLTTPETIPLLRGNEFLIFRALCNVLGNAIAYGAPQSCIEVEVTELPAASSPLGRETTRIDISNEGQGIPPEDLPLIFERFQRASPGKGVQGSGLGLYAVKCICEAHKAEILATSTPGERTTFTFFFPIYQAPPSSRATAKS
jgi:signal transduction histidine kinase